MEITEVRVKLMEDSDDRLRAFCSLTFDDAFVVRDLKIIDGSSGPFVAMPSRKLTSHCPQCGAKNHLRANYCNQCGQQLPQDRVNRDHEGRIKLYADIAHPINSVCRELIQERVISEYQDELRRSQSPDYVSRYDDDYFDEGEDYEPLDEIEVRERSAPTKTQIEPAETTPPPPHKRPSSRPDAQPQDRRERSSAEGFGAGIFDD
jgi:stage V sporulation protein G